MLRRLSGKRDAAFLQADEVPGHRQSARNILFDEDNGNPRGNDGGKCGLDIANDDRREAKRYLIERDEVGVGH